VKARYLSPSLIDYFIQQVTGAGSFNVQGVSLQAQRLVVSTQLPVGPLERDATLPAR
jgi:hypothetical protein